MGRKSDKLDPDGDPKLHLRHVPFIDGDYDQGGTYWGGPANLYVAWGVQCFEGVEDEFTVYLRANSRDDAKSNILAECPKAKFFR